MLTTTPQSFFDFFCTRMNDNEFALHLLYVIMTENSSSKINQCFPFAQNLEFFVSKIRLHKIRIVDGPFWN